MVKSVLLAGLLALLSTTLQVVAERESTPVVITGPENYTLADSTEANAGTRRLQTFGLVKVSDGVTAQNMAQALLGSTGNLQILSASYTGNGQPA